MPNVYSSADEMTFLSHQDALQGLQGLPDDSVDLCLTDPPWNTGKVQMLQGNSYPDHFPDFRAFLLPILQEMYRVLMPNSNCIVHMGIQEAHNVRCWMDEVFGKRAFVAELIAHHEVGRGTGADGWAQKHSHILVYRKGRASPFHMEHVPTVTRKAPVPGYTGDKLCNSVLPATLSTGDGQRVGYPSQKHVGVYESLIRVYSDPGASVLDPFAGSGTTGDAARRAGRVAMLYDQNPQAIDIIKDRLQLQLVME